MALASKTSVSLFVLILAFSPQFVNAQSTPSCEHPAPGYQYDEYICDCDYEEWNGEREQILRSFFSWDRSVRIGLYEFVSSTGWFTAEDYFGPSQEFGSFEEVLGSV
jgi:hypothetical protein